MNKEVIQGEVGKELIEDSRGCVFCDLGLDTAQAGLGGGHYHEIRSRSGDHPATRFILCTVKS